MSGVDTVGSLHCGLHEYRRICRESGSGKFAGGYSCFPCLFFLIATGLAFSTGTSWGTFGILIPIALAILGTGDVSSLSVTVAAILAGAVCGDHISPISDTTILASAGARVQSHQPRFHADTVRASGSSVLLAGYLTAGIAGNGWAELAVGVICLAVILAVITVNERTPKVHDFYKKFIEYPVDITHKRNTVVVFYIRRIRVKDREKAFTHPLI